MSNTQEMKNPEMEAEVTPRKKSELLSDQQELFALSETLLKEMQEREYTITLKAKKIFDSLLKFLEKDSPWGHTTATGLIMLYHNLREQKEFVRLPDWDGTIKLRAANVTILWTMVTKMTGKGFYEAKSFVELMAVCGESLSKAVQAAHNDNAQLRETHHKLSIIDDQLAGADIINDVSVDENIMSLADEVNPVVES